jgi:hypothetical protein
MLTRIITGGRPGAERAALEAAQALDLGCRGWCAELPDPAVAALGLEPLPAGDGRHPDDANILEGDGLLIVSYGELQGHAEAMRQKALAHDHPWLHADLVRRSKFDAALTIRNWIVERRIAALTVSGASSVEHPAIGAATRDLIESVYYLLQIGWRPEQGAAATPPAEAVVMPATVAEAVGSLIGTLPLKDRTLLANLSAGELSSLNPSLGEYILRRFDLAHGNADLLASCRFVAGAAGSDAMPPESAAAVILHALWEELRRTHRLRVVR